MKHNKSETAGRIEKLEYDRWIRTIPKCTWLDLIDEGIDYKPVDIFKMARTKLRVVILIYLHAPRVNYYTRTHLYFMSMPLRVFIDTNISTIQSWHIKGGESRFTAIIIKLALSLILILLEIHLLLIEQSR